MPRETEWLRKIKSREVIHHQPCVPLENTEREEVTKPETIKSTGPLVPNQGPKGFSRIAGMDRLKQLIQNGFINVLKNPERAALYGITVPNILLYGPAGCGKTYFAERVAEEVGINFMKISPDDLSSVYIHGTQKKIGELFMKAESKAPTLLFLDEFDCMVPKRSNDPNHQYQTDEVDEFLTMLNDTSKRGIYIIAATNHPENIDSSILRTGRIDEKIYVPMPDQETRENLFRLELKSRPVSTDIDFCHLAELTKGYNCSDINYIVKVAAREKFNTSIVNDSEELIEQSDLERTISKTAPSVKDKDIRSFDMVSQEFAPLSERKEYRIGFR